MKFNVIFLLTFLTSLNFAQNINNAKYTANNKGKFYIFWGGNRAYYTYSNINFKGENYDFTLSEVSAKDKPKGWHIDYINPARMTIPQTNLRIGYFINNNYNISIGVDHMKYVMIQNKTVPINGNIQTGSDFDGKYINDYQKLNEDFLTFEHTDGLNYINTEFSRVDDISNIFGIKNTDKFQINITEGLGAGILFPKTNTTLMAKERYDEFHVSGFGLSTKLGLNFTFFKHFFIQTEAKGGYIDMQDIRTTNSSKDKASQNFFFFETVIAFGTIFKL